MSRLWWMYCAAVDAWGRLDGVGGGAALAGCLGCVGCWRLGVGWVC